jgi:hypothetical protein
MIGIVNRVPRGSVPAAKGSPRRDGQCTLTYRQSAPQNVRSEITQPQSFTDYVGAQDTHILHLLEHADLTEDAAGKVISQLYQQRSIAAGTDGGLLNGSGTFGYVWANHENSEVLTSGCGAVPGHPISMSSTRTELCGLFAALTYMRLAIAYYHMVLPKGGDKTHVYCDSKAALSRVQDLFYEEFGTTWRCRAL